MTDIKEQLDIVNGWAKVTITAWRENIVKMKIGNTQDLYNSFVEHVINQANGDKIKIEFAFKYYGKFVDMGVGKGVKIGDVKENSTSRRLEGKMTGNRRRAKKWYTKELRHQVLRLEELLSEKYGRQVQNMITENIKG